MHLQSTLMHDRSSFARAETANGEREWMDERQQQQQQKASRRRSKAKAYHPSKTESKPTKQQAKTYERRRPQRTNTQTHTRTCTHTHSQANTLAAHAHDEHRDTILTHTHSFARVLKRYANKIATATTRANNIPTAAAAAAGQLCGEFARIMRISNTHTHSEKHSQSYTPIHPYTCTCILNTCFVLVAVFVIIAVAGHSRHHGCCCCCSIHSFCCIYATRVRYISQSVAGVLPDFAFQPTRLPFYVAIRSTTQLIKLTSIHSNSNYNNNNNNNFFYQLQKVIVSSIVPCFSFSSFAFLF